MSKTHLTPAEINRISTEYLEAVHRVKGERAMDLTDITYRKGFFYLRSPEQSKEAPAVPHRPKEIQAMTERMKTDYNAGHAHILPAVPGS